VSDQYGNPIPFLGVAWPFPFQAAGLCLVVRGDQNIGDPYTWYERYILKLHKNNPSSRFTSKQDVEPHYLIRRLERFGPPTPQTEVIKKVDRVVGQLKKEYRSACLVHEMFAVGKGAVSAVHREIAPHGNEAFLIQVARVRVSNTMGAGGEPHNGIFNVPRHEVLAELGRVISEGRLHPHPNDPLSKGLISDLQNAAPNVNRMPSFDLREGRELEDDDLVYALGCSVWFSEVCTKKFYERELDDAFA